MIAMLARAAVARPRWVAAITVACALLALVPALRLPLDALPDLTNNQVVVLTGAAGRSPEEVERIVTRPIEVALSGLPSLREQRSTSRYGISSVTAVFEDGVDRWRARQMVSERLAGVQLPEGVDAPALGPLSGGLGEIYHLTISSSRRSLVELFELATLRVAPLLRAVPGVVEVNSWGGAQRTLDVVAQPLQLAARGLSLSELRDALRDATGVVPGGALASHEGQVLLRAEARPARTLDLGAAVVRAPALRADDIGEVVEGTKLRLGAATADGRGETVYLLAQMLRDENALEVLGRIHAQLPALRAVLPGDVRLVPVYDRSVLVRATLRTVGQNLLEGGALVVCVLFAFLGSLRAGLIVASVIPLAMLFAAAIMALAGWPGNLMSLGALDFGLLVDGAIVLVAGVFHGARGAGASFRASVREVAGQAARPVFFSVLVILLVYVPVLSLTGTDGKLFRPMATTVVLALGFALVLSLTWVPALLALFLREEHVPKRPPLAVRVLERVYPRLLSPALAHRGGVAALAVSLLALGGLLASRRGVEFTPQLDEGDMVIQTTRRPDISLEQAIEAALALERALTAHVPEVHRVVSRIGSPAVATDLMGYEQADVFVALAPRDRWRAGLTRNALISEMRRVVENEAPGGELSFSQPIQMRFNELLGGAVTDVTVSVYGEDLYELRRAADALARTLVQVPGAKEVRVLAPPTVPLLTVRPDPLGAAQFGLRAREVLEVAQAVQVGIPIGQTYRGPLPIPLRLRLAASQKASALAELAVPIPAGGVVPLGRVAELAIGDTPGVVQRRNGQRRLLVGFNVRDADLGSVVQDASLRVARELQLERGYRLVWGGQYESLSEAARRLARLVPAVLALILVVLAVTFRALKPALLVFALVPFAAVGGVGALAGRDLPISLPAAIGFIALSGIAVMNGVVWMARALELRAQGLEPPVAAREAALDRARPVLMTALVAALGFLPMMLSRGVGAEVQRPLATVVVGGLVSSTALTLFVLPALYPWLAGRKRFGGPRPRRS